MNTLPFSSRRGSANTNAPIILSIFTFYIVIIVLMGFIGGSIVANKTFSTPDSPNAITFLVQIGYFFSGIGFVLSGIPAWVNIILFLPLSITLVYILLSFFRGSS